MINSNVIWKKKKLGDLLKYEQPTKYIVSSENYNRNFPTPVLTAGKSFVLGHTDEREGIYSNLPAIIFDDFTTESKYVDFPFKVKSSAMKILTVDPQRANIKFLHYLLSTVKVDSEQHKRYWISKFAEMEVSVPNLPTQNHIARILDKADFLRKKDQQLFKYYDDLAESLFIDMFGDPVRNARGWKVKPLGEVVEFASGLIDPKANPYADMYHVGGDNIISKSGELINLVKAKDLNLISGKYLFNDSHILYNKIRPYLNKVAKPTFEGICSADMYPLKPKSQNITKHFLWSVMTSAHFLAYASSVSRRANIPKINQEELSKYVMPIPPLDIQLAFSRVIDKIEQQKQKVKQQIAQSENLFQALLQQAFNGGFN